MSFKFDFQKDWKTQITLLPIFHPHMESDNRNNVMRFNRFLSKRYMATFICVLMLIGIYYLAGVFKKFFMIFPDDIKGAEYTIMDYLTPAHISIDFGKYYLIYIMIFAICCVVYYKVRISFGEKYINKHAGAKERWTTPYEIFRQYKRVPMRPSYEDEKGVKHTNWIKGKGGTPISRWRDSIYIDKELTNNIFIGSTRSGKGEMYVFETIDLMSRAEKIENRASMIISDPKIELYKSSKKTLEDRGYIVRLLNLDNPNRSAGYNPLTRAIEHYKRGEIEKCQQSARAFAYSIFYTDDELESIWKGTATSLFTALIVANITDLIRLDEKINYERREYLLNCQGNFEKLTPKLQEIVRENWKLWEEECKKTKKDILSWDRSKYIPSEVEFIPINENEKKINIYSIINFFKYLCDMSSYSSDDDKKAGKEKADTVLDDYFNQRPELDYARNLYAEIKQGGDRTKGSIYVNMQNSLSIFALNSIAKMTAENDIDFAEIGYGEKPVAVFLGIPSEDKSNHFLISTFIAQLCQYLFILAKNTKGKLDRDVRVIIDEFGNIPVIEGFEEYITIGLGYRIAFDLFLQSFNQLDLRYKESAGTIRDNCANQIYILSTGNESADEFEKALGNKTVIDVQRSGSALSIDKNYSESTKEVPLMTANELKHLREGETVLTRGNTRKDQVGASIKNYPIYNEYPEELGFFRELLLMRKIKKAAPKYIKDQERFETFEEKRTRMISERLRYLGSCFYYRYQYMEDDFPNPTDIHFDDICDESRDKIEYTKLVNDPIKVAEEVKEKIEKKGAKKLNPEDVKELYNFYQLCNLLYKLLGRDWEKVIGFNKESKVDEAKEKVLAFDYKNHGINENTRSLLLQLLAS